jgi:hypothetical protein
MDEGRDLAEANSPEFHGGEIPLADEDRIHDR